MYTIVIFIDKNLASPTTGVSATPPSIFKRVISIPPAPPSMYVLICDAFMYTVEPLSSTKNLSVSASVIDVPSVPESI